ncbi:KR domain-containing protein [Paenibacillus sp. GSMTC-2017]|uniref:beta-ketoacyl synthase N-terminal-like domain-containing protein n=1 Tax=Paenibacillus sp. GSMTC-2017 TaxID=2794350 RepID=UPI0018D88492|nr:beta-ketoacyl synthase N-terminal-like domain-containing protein [Paenibacillus sp. GSMTC-2017]MBH5320083.1 KR domain-containing protein [Paenibacillus sp. GSMTC-2017]
MQASEYIFGQIKKGNLNPEVGKSLLEEILPDDVAIVGISCEYTDARDTFEFYKAVKLGKRGFKPFPENRVNYIPKDHPYLLDGAAHLKTTPEEFLARLCNEKGAYLEDIETFDYEFFGINEDEARYIDPTHRLVLKHSYLGLEDAGIRLDKIKDSKTAIYIGKDKSITASYRSEIEEDSNHVNAGNWEGILASRLNYLYNMSGGSFVIDTACSSSLVAAHLAVKTLRDKEIDTAIVGGIALGLFPRQGSVVDQYSNVETPRSFLKVFEAESQGTIFGEGVGIVILKRLKDAIADNDNIHAVIRGSMINSDGRSNGLTAPNPHAQKDLLLEAYERSNISPETVEYVDAHGTGTKLGDPIEARGLTDAYKKYVSKKSFCALSSLKENIGHTVGAAGVGGMIKMSLALRNKEIFPNKGFEAPNEYIRFVDSPFYIPTQVTPWVRGKYPRRGGVSSFGFSGTNAHVILEEFERKQDVVQDDKEYPFIFSGQSVEQLVSLLKKFIVNEEFLKSYRLSDIAYTLVHRRNRYAVGIGFQASTADEFNRKLKQSIVALEKDTLSDAEGIFSTNSESISSDMKKLMQHRLRSGGEVFPLTELIQLQLDGLETALDSFSFDGAQTVSLPTYEFKREVLWANVKKYTRRGTSGPSLAVKATLIKKQTLRSDKSDVYQVTLSPSDWFVDDHRIGGKRTFSGTTYTQLASELALLYFKTPGFTLEKLYFKNLIQLEEKGDKTFQVHVNKSGKQLEVEVFSYENDDLEQYVTHAVFVLKKQDELQLNRIDIKDEIESHPQPTTLGNETSNFFKGRWDFINHEFKMARRHKQEILLSLNLSNEFSTDLDSYNLHPSILDGILGAMVYERAQVRNKTYLPLSYGKFTFTGNKFTQKVYSVTELLYDPDADHDIITANIAVHNEQGDVVAYLEKYVMKAFANMFLKPQMNEIRYELSDKVVAINSLTKVAGAKVLYIGNDNGKAVSNAAIELDYADYRELTQKTERYDYVIYTPWLGQQEQLDAAKVEEESAHYFRFAKSASKYLKRGGKLIVAADHGFSLDNSGGNINPLQYALLSSGRIPGLENTGFTTLTVQISEFSIDSLLAIALIEELAGKKVVFESGNLYEEALVEVRELERKPVELADGDTVIVTGGYGGVGLEYMEQLFELNPNIRIAALGRNDIFTALTAKQERTPAEEAKLNRILHIQAKGEVTFHRCDIAVEQDVKRVFDELTGTGTIAGIVHLAGVPEEGMLFTKTEEEFLRIAAPKVIGTTLLRNASANLPLQFFVTSSSMTTIVGSAGQFSYTFANAFLEGASLADERITSIQWPGWNDTGMALNFGDIATADEHLLMKSIPAIVGREYIRLTLDANTPRVIVGEFNNEKMEEYLGSYIRLPNLEGRKVVRSEGDESANGASPYKIKSFESLTVTGAEMLNETQKFITVVFASVLDLDQIDVKKTFTELGGDSLKAFGIYAPIAEQFKIDMEVADVFIYPTILQLSEYVEELLEDAAA